jgi:hypothetical protein
MRSSLALNQGLTLNVNTPGVLHELRWQLRPVWNSPTGDGYPLGDPMGSRPAWAHPVWDATD